MLLRDEKREKRVFDLPLKRSLFFLKEFDFITPSEKVWLSKHNRGIIAMNNSLIFCIG
jgi:hypothetical protein